MKYFYILLSIYFITSCRPEDKSDFNKASMEQTVYDVNMQSSTMQEVLSAHKGSKIMIDLWASWCKDCLKSLPDIAQFQKNNPDVKWVFLSVDDEEQDWRKGMAKYMDKYAITGDQYFFDTGWSQDGDNSFISYIELDWIPRYMLLDEDGDILVYYAKKITDNKIKSALEK